MQARTGLPIFATSPVSMMIALPCMTSAFGAFRALSAGRFPAKVLFHGTGGHGFEFFFVST